jgi:hypothetical protein
LFKLRHCNKHWQQTLHSQLQQCNMSNLLQIAPRIVQYTPAISAPLTLTGSTVISMQMNPKTFSTTYTHFHLTAGTHFIISLHFAHLTFSPTDSTVKLQANFPNWYAYSSSLCPPFSWQIFLIIHDFEKCNFILMHSSNLDWFQLTVVIILQTACWSINRGGRAGSKVLCWAAEVKYNRR